MRSMFWWIALMPLLLLAACSSESAPPRADVLQRDRALGEGHLPDLSTLLEGGSKDKLTVDGSKVDGASCTGGGTTPHASMCSKAGECKCPDLCLLGSSQKSGSCWGPCDTAKNDPQTHKNPACSNAGAGEACLATDTQAACLPLGAISGTFSLPVDTNTPTALADFGKASVTLDVAGLKKTFELGYGVPKSATKWVFLLHAKDAKGDPDYTGYLGLSFNNATEAGSYAVGSHDLYTSKGISVMYLETTYTGDQITREVLHASIYDGTLKLTTAATGGKQLTTGEIVAGSHVFRWDVEICGPSTTAC